MTKVTDVYGEGYKNLLSASHLKENPNLCTTYTIQSVEVREIGKLEPQKKVVIDIGIGDYELALNKTNARELEKAFGEVVENWQGKQIELKLGKSTYKGNPVDSVFVEPKQ
ncbi:hypothetical protein AKJ54_00690 [candidate division MSBL1 archaeon SCGC-AAA382K21]|uniref:Uncharacterized protein n=1 Tax=candidate division MSBL1 archaeon SCGC-AAA382K21 TaxID=1698283 RepID=A0A133VL35_9EURY|nr:hypothetical protein AKJ54_00690 [candidate division MSBL1 archaeon SCGC-AAA382K21]